MIGLLVSQRDLDLQQVTATEMISYPPSMFHADGQMRVATGKFTLKKHIQVEAFTTLNQEPNNYQYRYVSCSLDS